MARAITCALLLVLVAGCSNGPLACTDIGAISGVSILFQDVVTAHPDQRLHVKACVESTCETLEVGRHGPETVIALGPGAMSDGDSPLSVTLTVTGRYGAVLFAGSAVAHPVRQQPNGPGCPPVVWVAQLTAWGTSDLRQTGPAQD